MAEAKKSEYLDKQAAYKGYYGQKKKINHFLKKKKKNLKKKRGRGGYSGWPASHPRGGRRAAGGTR
jgi:hypothetical protein